MLPFWSNSTLISMVLLPEASSPIYSHLVGMGLTLPPAPEVDVS